MKTEFERELEKLQHGDTRSILIGAMRNNPIFINCLFDEFKQTPKKKDVSKYLIQFNIDRNKEYELNEKMREFYNLKETPKEFCTHDITKTNIYRNFKDVEVVLCELMETMRDPNNKAEIICNIVETLHPEIKELVINTLIEDNENIYLNLNFVLMGNYATQTEKEKWHFVKVVFNDKLSEYKKEIPKRKTYIGIAERLSHYIKNATDFDLTYIIDSKKLPPEKQVEKPIWIGDKADAVRFCDKTGLKISEFNKCFDLSDSKKLLNANRSKDSFIDGDGKVEITNILKETLN